jgi:SAM-dependent methyltransferase
MSGFPIININMPNIMKIVSDSRAQLIPSPNPKIPRPPRVVTTQPLESIIEKPKYKRLTNCVCCGNSNLFEILDLKSHPIANNFNDKLYFSNKMADRYELKLMGCEVCWHSQLSIAVDPDILFKNYISLSGISDKRKEYLQSFSKRYCTVERGRVLDIGCNDGTLLDIFNTLGWQTFGVDPAENLYSISTEKGHIVTCDYWSPEVADEFNPFDLIVAQNVFTHTSDINTFLQSCIKVMHDDTMLVIQTSNSEMFDKNEYEMIHHDRISYFSINSMQTAVTNAGLFLNKVSLTNTYGQSYTFEIGKTNKRHPKVDLLLTGEKHKYNRQFYENYKNINLLNYLHELKRYIDSELDPDRKTIAYGASTNAMTVLNMSKIKKIDYIIDDNKLKQGLMSIGSNIPIVSSDILLNEHECVNIIIFAWDFYDEIYKKIKTMRPWFPDTFINLRPFIGYHH